MPTSNHHGRIACTGLLLADGTREHGVVPVCGRQRDLDRELVPRSPRRAWAEDLLALLDSREGGGPEVRCDTEGRLAGKMRGRAPQRGKGTREAGARLIREQIAVRGSAQAICGEVDEGAEQARRLGGVARSEGGEVGTGVGQGGHRSGT
jgi:hypothetical protein